MPALAGQWHHRRSRRVRDKFRHSPCNGLWLCLDCHAWVHAHPLLARQSGWIVSQHESDPSSVPVVHALWGRVRLTHDGGWVPAPEEAA